MIKLFKETDTVYKTNGEVVINATKCRVYNEDGGEFKLSLTCPISYSKYIENNYIIVVPTPAGEQPFRIYEIEKSQNKIDINARHITYDSMDYVIADSYAVDKTCGEAMEHFNDATDNPSPFSVYSDIEEINTLRIVRKSLYEAINEVNERWGGHIVRDMFSISNLSQIGRDNGITIEYRKNLQSITATYDFSGVCTKLLPVGRDGTLLDTLYVYSPVQYEIPHTKVVDFEQDIERDDYPSEEAYIAALKADLLAQATDYVNTYCYPSVNYSLKGKPEKVTDIGDVIKVKDERLGIDILTQVISYEFDCITETYKSLEFGNFTDSLSNLMSNISTSTNETVNKAIQNLPSQNEATEEKSGLMSASDKTKLDGIEAGAQKNVQADWDETDPSADSYIKNKPSSLGDVTGVKGNAESTYRTGNVNLTPANLGLETKQASQGGTDESLVTTGEKYTYLHVADSKADNTPTFTEASTRANLAGSGETMPTILGKIKKFFSDLKAVAFSGSYDDLTNKPTIPAAQVQSDWNETDNTKVDFIKNKPSIPAAQVNSDWNATSGVAQILNKPSLAAVATSGAYSDLTGTPTIPTVNNSTITIKKNGTTVDSFTLNQSTGKDIDISVPTKTSDLTNDSGFVTTDEKVTAEDVNPTSETMYDFTFVPHSTRTTNQKPKVNSDCCVYLRYGTTSVIGYSILRLGNGTASGSAGNKYGCLRIYSEKSGYVNLLPTASSTTGRNISLPDKAGTIALTADLTTYAFAEGTNNGEIKITPSVGGTAGTAVTVKPKGISDLAYIAKGSGSSKFLREDGTWQTVTASWSGGTITSSILPNATETLNLGSSTKKFASGYIQYLESYTGEFRSYVKAGSIEAGKANNESGYLTMWQANSSYNAHFVPPSTAYTSNVEVTLPSASGTLATTEVISIQNDKARLSKTGKSVVCTFSGLDAYAFRAGIFAVLISDAYARFRPAYAVCGFSFIYKANNDMYMATMDVTTSGVLAVHYISSILASGGKMVRSVPGNSGHLLWGTMCWTTA